MIHRRVSALFFFALCAISASSAQSFASSTTCSTAQVKVPSTSLCQGGTLGVCTSIDGVAELTAAGLAFTSSYITQQGQTSAGTAVCSALGGSLASGWTNPSLVCPQLPSCQACGGLPSAGTTATVNSTTATVNSTTATVNSTMAANSSDTGATTALSGDGGSTAQVAGTTLSGDGGSTAGMMGTTVSGDGGSTAASGATTALSGDGGSTAQVAGTTLSGDGGSTAGMMGTTLSGDGGSTAGMMGTTVSGDGGATTAAGGVVAPTPLLRQMARKLLQADATASAISADTTALSGDGGSTAGMMGTTLSGDGGSTAASGATTALSGDGGSTAQVAGTTLSGDGGSTAGMMGTTASGDGGATTASSDGGATTAASNGTSSNNSTALPVCCASVRLYVEQFCTGIPNLDTIVAPAGNLSEVWSIPGLAGLDSCADNNCQPFGSASTATYSVVAMVVAAMLALAAMY